MTAPLRRRKQTRKTRHRTRRQRIVQRGGRSTAPTWVILQYDNRQLSYEFKQLVKVNQNYAHSQGYDYIFDSSMYHMPPYWIKVKLTNDLLKKTLPNGHLKYKGVMFIDTDAVIVKPDQTLDEITSKSKDFMAASDINYDLFPNAQSPFNAGVFIVKNTPKAQAIFEDWLTVYEAVKKFWVFNGNTWHTNGNWAGAYYEQGSFVDQILPKHRAIIDLVDKQILQAQYIPQIEAIRPETFVIHFSHTRKNLQLPSFLQNELTTLLEKRAKN
jgi:hypothetical protein